MRSGPIKLSLVLRRDRFFGALCWICVSIYLLYSTNLMNFKPATSIQWAAIYLGSISLFSYWFFLGYYLIDPVSLKIWKCTGNRLFVDRYLLAQADAINSFAVDFWPEKSLGFCLIAITDEAEKVRISDFRQVPIESKSTGETISKHFSRPFHYQDNTGGVIVTRGTGGEIEVSHKDPFDIIREVKWNQILLVMIPILVGFCWLMLWVKKGPG